MTNLLPLKSACCAALLVTALGATPASAQDSYGSNVAYGSDTENVQVNAPRFRVEGSRMRGSLEKISLSGAVRYDDLNLRTRGGARELYLRVRDEAQNVCMHLEVAYPVREAPGTSCYKTALENATLRANAAIRDARDYRTYSD